MRQNIKELPEFVELAFSLGVRHVLIQDLMILEARHKEYSLYQEPELADLIFRHAAKIALEREVSITQLSEIPYLKQAMGDYLKLKPQYRWDRTMAETRESISGDYLGIGCWDRSGMCFDPWESFRIRSDGGVFTMLFFLDYHGKSIRTEFCRYMEWGNL
jgi:MoaA/NifB/PqqE/SkfB family radical SAM enzyme